MTKTTARFVALLSKRWTIFGFGCFGMFFLLFGAMFVGSWAESGPQRETASRSLEDQPLQPHSFTTVLSKPRKSSHDIDVIESDARKNSSSAEAEHSVLPPKILTPSHLPFLRDLLSDKKITVRLGLHVSLTGPSDLLDPQLLLSMYKEPGIYNIGEKAGLFSMKVVAIKRVTSTP